MNKAKLWLAQIALVAIVGLVFGSPALAGGVNVNASPTGKANASLTANGGGGGENGEYRGSGGGQGGGQPQSNTTGTVDNTGTDEPVCARGDTDGCTEDTCEPSGGEWGIDSVCYFW